MSSSARLLLATFALALLPGTLRAFGYGYTQVRYGVGPGFGYNPVFTRAYYDVASWPGGYQGYEAMSDEDLYLGSRRKGDRYMARNQYSRATREYREALRRAERYFGRESSQSREATRLLAEAQGAFQRYGDARQAGAYQRARARGDRLLDRGEFGRAAAQYQDALAHAHTDAQAQEMVALLVQARGAGSARGGPARVRGIDDYRGRGDDAMQVGDYKAALGFYASALTRTSKVHGPESRQTRELSRLLTRAQEALAGAPTGPAPGLRYAD